MPEPVPTGSARLQRTRSILSAHSKPLDAKIFRRKKNSKVSPDKRYQSMTERSESVAAKSEPMIVSPKREMDHKSWKYIDSPYRLEPYL